MVDDDPGFGVVIPMPLEEPEPINQHAPKSGEAPFGMGGYGDETEHVGPPQVIVVTPPFRPFFDTDARSVLLTLMPHHYNLIPNPAFRTNTAGWVFTGITPTLDAADSWVGRSLVYNGASATARFREAADKFVYVGPMLNTQENQWDYRRGGGQYTLSVYVKGTGDVRLRMDAYNPIDRNDLKSGPEYQNLTSVASPSTYAAGAGAVIETGTGRVWRGITPTPAVAPFYEDTGLPPAMASVEGMWTPVTNDGKWHRISIKTTARVEEGAGRVSFMGARWIDSLLEIRNAIDLRISAVMLDPTEEPCDYFDGGMNERPLLDDFLWENLPDNSVSYYYYDRVVRAKWLWERMGYAIPVNRPYQIFFGSYWRPYKGTTGETILLTVPASLENYEHEAVSLNINPLSARMVEPPLEEPEDDAD